MQEIQEKTRIIAQITKNYIFEYYLSINYYNILNKVYNEFKYTNKKAIEAEKERLNNIFIENQKKYINEINKKWQELKDKGKF